MKRSYHVANSILMLAVLASGLLLNACAIHRIDIQQGNVIDAENHEQLQLGMSQQQVQYLFGTPLIVDPFRSNRWDYIYVMDKPGEPLQEHRVTVMFEEGKVVRIIRDAPVTEVSDPTTPHVSDKI